MPFIDDELEVASSYEVDQHLSKCACCRAEAEAIRAYDARIKSACCSGAAAGAACEAVRARLLRALDECCEQERRSARRRSFYRRTAAVAAAALLAIGLVIGFLPGPASADFASDHTLCLQGRSWLYDPGEIARLCQSKAGAHATVVCLAAAGYQLAEGAPCRIDGVEYTHLVYTAPGKDPVSIYVGRRLGGLAGRLRGDDRSQAGPFEVVRIRCPAGTEYVTVVRAGEEPRVASLVRAQVRP